MILTLGIFHIARKIHTWRGSGLIGFIGRGEERDGRGGGGWTTPDADSSEDADSCANAGILPDLQVS